jgi:transposase
VRPRHPEQDAAAQEAHKKYSPELNPVENIWQFLRQNHLANRVFDHYAAIADACCDAWNALTAAPDTIRSIATRPWAEAVIA